MATPIEDWFMGASLDKGQGEGDSGDDFDAGQYSFFGDLTAGDDGLEGALEEGLEAPPEEELELDRDLQLDDDEDLSYASMFAVGLDHNRHDEQTGSMPDGLADGTAADGDNAGLLTATESASTATPPSKLKPGSIALGGLLAGTPSSGLPTTPLGQGTPFGSLPGSSGRPFMSSTGFGGPSVGMSQPLQDPAIAHIGPPPSHLQPGMPPAMQPLSAQELEAQLLGMGAPQHATMGPHSSALPQYPPMPPSMMGPGGQFPPLPPHMQPPMQGAMLPPPHHMQPQQQQPFEANGNPWHRPPPMHGGPPRSMGPGGFGPLPPPLMGGPPMHPPPHFPPPPLGAGMPRGPMHMRPGMPPAGVRPGPPGPFRPYLPGGMPMAPPMHPGPWGRPPPVFSPGFNPNQQQPPTLAQRLRALNLADRHEGDRFPVLRRRYYSKFMDHEEIESILHMQWKPLHMGTLYVEDYYYQAFVYKHYNKRNKRIFAPESVRELAPTEKVAPDQVTFVKLEGLGKVPFSNIRRPRPLMDIAPHKAGQGEGASNSQQDAEGEAAADGGTQAPSKPLEQEPLLAARIMIEDCMALLLDVEDIDRIFVANGGGPLENEDALRTRRVLLMEGFAVSLRLPESPVASAADQREGGKPEMSDGVFVRLMSLPKGKTLTARALRLVYPPDVAQLASGQTPKAVVESAGKKHPANLRIVWAVMRNLRGLFSGKAASSRGGKDAAALAKDDLAATAKLAGSAAELVKQLPQAQAVCDCLAAIVAGDLDGATLPAPEGLLLPLLAPGYKASDSQVPWLANVLEALLQRAAELDLLPDTSAAASAAPVELASIWQEQFGALHEMLHRHVSSLYEALQAGREVGDVEGCTEVRGLVPIDLIRTMLPHCSKPQQEEMRTMLLEFGA